MKRGQYIRLLLSPINDVENVIAAAKQLSLHGTAQTEESSTKDTTGDDLEFEVTSLGYEITGSALVLADGDELLSSAVSLRELENWLKNQLLKWRICVMEGDNNRTIVEEIAHGQAKLTNLQAQAPNKQNTTYNYTLAGYGAIVPGTSTQSTNVNSGD
jgi:hypothetical protein